MSETLLSRRTDFSDVAIVRAPLGELADSAVRVDVGPFALTANNITYMVTGDMIGYWKYFDPEAYGIDMPDYGCMPVWGYGRVSESRCESVKTGQVIYGFFPPTQTLDLTPGKVTAHGFQDFAPHRRPLHSLYNSYMFTDADPSFGVHQDLQPVLRPLFTTSFLIDDFFGREDFFGAKQIILTSASSKTALGTAFCLKRRGGAKVIGLTSAGNADFVKGTGFYDQVVTYDKAAAEIDTASSAIIDMAGNGDVSAALYAHLGADIVYNCMIGKSHWTGAPPPKITEGAAPKMFFAPDYAKARIGEWGPDGFAKRLGAQWLPFCDTAKDWLSISKQTGTPAFLKAYQDHLNGTANPKTGYLFTL